MLEILSSTDGLRIIFSLLFISTILFVYEVTLFFKVIVPTVSSQIDSSLEKIGKNSKKIFSDRVVVYGDKVKDFIDGTEFPDLQGKSNQYDFLINNMNDFEKNQFGGILNTENNQNLEELPNVLHKFLDLFRIREDRLNNKINDYTVYTAIILFIIFSSILYYIKSILNSRSEDIGTCVWSNIGVSLFFIFIFQYVFYKYGQVYKYLGSEGNEELIGYLLADI